MTNDIFEEDEIIITSLCGPNRTKLLQFNFGIEYKQYKPKELLHLLKEATKAIEKSLK